mmetsp:Transcript_35469/g.82309  ORF Transcript_35469/g.82309 Transcript_35469/m.82309 type:complete len:81 (+) Transcript_35469:3596-3838(+)
MAPFHDRDNPGKSRDNELAGVDGKRHPTGVVEGVNEDTMTTGVDEGVQTTGVEPDNIGPEPESMGTTVDVPPNNNMPMDG